MIYWVFAQKFLSNYSTYSTFKYLNYRIIVLSNTWIWAWFLISSVHLCVCVAFMGDFFLKNLKKTSGVIFVCSGLERIRNSLTIRKMADYEKHWKVGNFLCSQHCMGYEKWGIFWLTSFKNCIPPDLHVTLLTDDIQTINECKRAWRDVYEIVFFNLIIITKSNKK